MDFQPKPASPSVFLISGNGSIIHTGTQAQKHWNHPWLLLFFISHPFHHKIFQNIFFIWPLITATIVNLIQAINFSHLGYCQSSLIGPLLPSPKYMFQTPGWSFKRIMFLPYPKPCKGFIHINLDWNPMAYKP